MTRKRCLAVLVPVLMASCAVPASAGAQEPPIPRDAPVVATSPSGARMLAFDRGRALCTVFLFPHESRSSGYPYCQRPRHRLREVNLAVGSTHAQNYYSGLVEPEVASVEFVFRGGRTMRVDTSAGEGYAGRHKGRVRFLIAEMPAARRLEDPRYLRLFDATGALLGIANAYEIAGTRAGPAHELVRGTTSGVRWAFQAFRLHVLAPLPGQEERFVDHSCVQVTPLGPRPRHRVGNLFSAYGRACMNPERRAGPEYALDQQCGPLGVVLTGIVRPDTRGVVAVLGDGRRRHVRLLPLPAAQGGDRAFALVLPRRVALRRLVRLTRGGRHIPVGGVGPGAARCGEEGSLAYMFGFRPAVPHGPVALAVYDDGVQLCATLGRPTARSDECRYPPVDPGDSWILSRIDGDSKLLVGIVPAGVVRAVVKLRGGRTVSVDTSGSEGVYGGQYAGALRLFTLQLPAGSSVGAMWLIEAGGRRTPTHYEDNDVVHVGPRRLVVGGPPGLRLRAQRYELARAAPFSAFLCISLGPGDCSGGSVVETNVRADCTPRRLVFWGLLGRRVRHVTVETDQGEFQARVRRLPRSLRTAKPGGPRFARLFEPVAAFVLAVPARARSTALVVSGRREFRRALRLPSAAEQCGYADFLI